MNQDYEPVEIEDVVAMNDTELAVRCIIDGESKWIPKSVIHCDSDVQAMGDSGTLIVPTWFAEREVL